MPTKRGDRTAPGGSVIASLSDISERAGVSIATASRVLNGSTHPVSEKTRKRVLDAAAEVGYAPSFVARALVKRKTPIIGVIVGDIVDPYFAEIARGVEDAAGRMGFLTMLSSSHRSTEVEIRNVRALRSYQASGVVFASSGFADDQHGAELRRAVDEIREGGSRAVALAHRDLDCTSVTFDNRAAAYDVTDYVASLGHRRIALVEGPAGLYTSLERREGFQAAMAAAGLDPTLRFDGGFEYEAGYDTARRIIATGRLPEAIVAVNDDVGIGILMGLRQAGVDVPGDVSVVGIDDTKPARYVGLTTVSAPLYELGLTAARLILAEDEEPQAGDIVLPHRLTPRTTTARRAR